VISIKQGEKYNESRVAERHRDHSLFSAFAPAEDPKIAIAVLVENGGFGARAAAPIARAAIDYYLLGKKPAGPAVTDDGPDDEEVPRTVAAAAPTPARSVR
jgi:penicillin-binding protein 2